MSFFGYFGKDPKDLFLAFSPLGSHWRVVTWNFELERPGIRRWTVEAHGPKTTLVHWNREHTTEVRFFDHGKILRKKRVPEGESEYRDLMNLAIHSTLKYGIEKNHEFMLTPVTGVTPMDMQGEFRALQWIQASFGTLTRALDSLQKNRDLVLTAACFSGKVPETGEDVLRLIAFNLDIFYYMRADQTLQIVVFDDKNQGHGKAQTPTFQQIIKVTKPQFYDEITKLLHHLALVGEIG